MPTPGAVIDTNVLLDLWLFDDPRVHDLRRAIESNRLRALRSADCDAEFADVLGRAEFGLVAEGRDRILARWSGCGDAIGTVRPAPLVCADAGDQKFLDAAFSAGARWLLTRDKALLALARRAEASGLRIASPVAALTYDR
jgi:predicted nucleic acid-binding protein